MATETSMSTAKHTPGPLRPQPFRSNPNITCLLPAASERWEHMMQRAKLQDRIAVESASRDNSVDADAFLCAAQRKQARAGYVLAAVETNIHGFCVRDTLNDGLGVLYSARGGGSAEAAIEFARRWHAEAPERREVIVGFIFDDRKAELAAAIAKATGGTA